MKKIIVGGIVGLLALVGIGGGVVLYKKKNGSSEETTPLHVVETEE